MPDENLVEPSTLWESPVMLNDTLESGEEVSELRNFGKLLRSSHSNIGPIAFCREQEVQVCIRQLDNMKRKTGNLQRKCWQFAVGIHIFYQLE